MFRVDLIDIVTIYTSRHNPQHLFRVNFGRVGYDETCVHIKTGFVAAVALFAAMGESGYVISISSSFKAGAR
jgi:hypothetical protein